MGGSVVTVGGRVLVQYPGRLPEAGLAADAGRPNCRKLRRETHRQQSGKDDEENEHGWEALNLKTREKAFLQSISITESSKMIKF
jgi:hypothetical protein